MDDYIRTLGKGCFGTVYKRRFGDTWAAVKEVPFSYITKEQLNRECRVYDKTNHNNVVKLLADPWLHDGKWHIPLEFIFGENLETTIFHESRSQISLTLKAKATIITGMCEGLLYLHRRDIVHQDLKPDNIMVEHGTLRAVIIDMGLAKNFVNGISSAQNMGNQAYYAPEILDVYGNRDNRSDVWAMGKIIAELFARVRLCTVFTLPYQILETPYCSVVSKMVVPNPPERASMNSVICEIRQAGVKCGAGGQSGLRQITVSYGPPVEIEVKPSLRDLIPVASGSLSTMFSQFALQPDGTTRHVCYNRETNQMRMKEMEMRNGELYRYEEVTFTKSSWLSYQ